MTPHVALAHHHIDSRLADCTSLQAREARTRNKTHKSPPHLAEQQQKQTLHKSVAWARFVVQGPPPCAVVVAFVCVHVCACVPFAAALRGSQGKKGLEEDLMCVASGVV